MNRSDTEAGTVADKAGDEDGGELGLTCNSLPFDKKNLFLPLDKCSRKERRNDSSAETTQFNKTQFNKMHYVLVETTAEMT